MAAQSEKLIAVFQAIGVDIKALEVAQGSLSSLTTADKTNLVAALNEINGLIAQSGAEINDASSSTDTVYSSSKVEASINAAISAVVDGSPAAFDTLKEIADYIDSDQDAMGTLTTALNNRVKFSEPQTLTVAQQLQACENIGVGDPSRDLLADYTAAKG